MSNMEELLLSQLSHELKKLGEKYENIVQQVGYIAGEHNIDTDSLDSNVYVVRGRILKTIQDIEIILEEMERKEIEHEEKMNEKE